MTIFFDGAKTDWKSKDAGFLVWGEGPAFSRQEEAGEYADDIITRFKSLQQGAASVAASATSYIDSCTQFSVTPQTISYIPPVFESPEFTNYPTSATLELDTGDPPSVNVEDTPSIDVRDQYRHKSPTNVPTTNNPIDKPTQVHVANHSALPSINTDYDFNLTPLTVGTVQTRDISNPEPPELDDSPLSESGEFVSIKPYELPEGIEEGLRSIQTAKDALNTLIDTIPTPTPYAPVFNSIFTCVGGLLSNFPFAATVIQQNSTREKEFRSEFDTRVQKLWGVMPLPESYSSAQSAWVKYELDRFSSQSNSRSAVASALASDDAKRLAFSLGAKAHQIKMDIDLGLIRAELSYLSELANSLEAWYEAVFNSYNSVATVWGADAEIYRVGLLQEETRVDQYATEAQQARVKQEVNNARASLFITQERAKKLLVQKYKSQLEGEKAKIAMFEASKEVEKAETAAMQGDLYKFMAEVSEWGAEAASLAAEYKIAIANINAVQQQNQALIDAENAQASKYSADAAMIAAQAAEVESELTKLQLSFVSKGLELAKVNAENEVEGYKAKEYGVQKARELQELATTLSINAGALDGRAAFNSEVVSYIKTAADAAYRAAEQTQRANSQLVEAYKSAQIAAGEASAALEAGKWSGWNVTASVKAAGSVGGSTSYGAKQDDSRSNQIIEADEKYISNG